MKIRINDHMPKCLILYLPINRNFLYILYIVDRSMSNKVSTLREVKNTHGYYIYIFTIICLFRNCSSQIKYHIRSQSV